MNDTTMNVEESIAQANALLWGAGWAPIPRPCWAGGFTMARQVGGVAPDGQQYVKGLDIILPGHPDYGPDTPDEHHEAAAWLVAFAKANTNPLSTEATLEPVAIESEAGEAPRTYDEATAEYFAEYPDEGDSETGETLDGGEQLLGASAPEGADVDDGAGAGLPEAGQSVFGSVDFADASEPLDADFEDAPDLGAELLDDEAFAHGELPAPDPLDFAPDEIEPEPEHSPGAFIFGDNLAHDRIVRIGQLSEYATELIAAAKAGYSDSEHDAVRSHVVTNLNEAGAYVGGNPKLFDRFIELETVTARIRRIEIYRDERQDFIRSADREAVASFDPAANWP